MLNTYYVGAHLVEMMNDSRRVFLLDGLSYNSNPILWAQAGRFSKFLCSVVVHMFGGAAGSWLPNGWTSRRRTRVGDDESSYDAVLADSSDDVPMAVDDDHEPYARERTALVTDASVTEAEMTEFLRREPAIVWGSPLPQGRTVVHFGERIHTDRQTQTVRSPRPIRPFSGTPHKIAGDDPVEQAASSSAQAPEAVESNVMASGSRLQPIDINEEMNVHFDAERPKPPGHVQHRIGNIEEAISATRAPDAARSSSSVGQSLQVR